MKSFFFFLVLMNPFKAGAYCVLSGDTDESSAPQDCSCCLYCLTLPVFHASGHFYFYFCAGVFEQTRRVMWKVYLFRQRCQIVRFFMSCLKWIDILEYGELHKVCIYIFIYIFFLAQESCATCLYSAGLFLNQRQLLSLCHTGGSAHGMYNDEKHIEVTGKHSRSINISTGIMLLAWILTRQAVVIMKY